MKPIALLMFLIAATLLWGGLAVCLRIALRREQEQNA